MNKNILQNIEDDPMTDTDIKKYLGNNTKIIEYDDLGKYSTIERLLPNNKDIVVILFREDNQGSAHWIGLARDNNNIYHFCSYGSYPDEYLWKWLNNEERQEVNETKGFMTDLLKKTNKNVFYNDIKYQELEHNGDDKISTCGRHLTNFFMNFLNNNMDLKAYYNYMKKLKQQKKQTYDEIVSEIIDIDD